MLGSSTSNMLTVVLYQPFYVIEDPDYTYPGQVIIPKYYIIIIIHSHHLYVIYHRLLVR